MGLDSYLKSLGDALSGKSGSVDYTDTLKAILKITSGSESGRLPNKPQLSEKSEYERLTYTPPTDEEISRQAETLLSQYLKSGLDAIESENKSKRESYNKTKDGLALALSSGVSEIDKTYASAIERAGNDALRRGLARSSVALNTVGALESERAKEKSDLSEKYRASIDDIDAKLNALESERVKAINDFNVGYTVKISEQIEKLKSERDKKQAEVIKYNNELAKTENKDEIDRAKAESDLYSEALSQKETENKLNNKPSNAQIEYENQQIYALLRDKLLQLDSISARNEVINNPLFRNYLTTEYYYQLYDEFAR